VVDDDVVSGRPLLLEAADVAENLDDVVARKIA